MRHGSFSRSTPLVASISHGCTRNILTASNQIILARATGGRSIRHNSKNRETSLHGFTSRAACEGVKVCFVIRSGLLVLSLRRTVPSVISRCRWQYDRDARADGGFERVGK